MILDQMISDLSSKVLSLGSGEPFWAPKIGGKVEGKINASRIAAAGNSCGGISSLHLAAERPAGESIYIPSGSVNPLGTVESNRQVLSKIKAPTICIVGGPDDVTRPNAEADYKVMPASTPVVLMRRDAFDHLQMTYEPEIRRDAAEISVAWFDATLRGNAAAARLVARKGCKTCEVRRWSVDRRNFGPAG